MGHTSFFLLCGGGREDMEFKEDREFKEFREDKEREG